MESISEETHLGSEGEDLLAQLCYASWLAEISVLPPEALEWDEEPLEQFIARLRQVAVDRRQSRAKGVRQLEIALAALLADATDELRFFDEFDRLDTWSAEHCDSDMAADVSERVADLHRAIVVYRALKATPPLDGTRVEHRLWRKQLDEHEAEIVEQGLWLQEQLTPPTEGPGPDTDVLPFGAEHEVTRVRGSFLASTPFQSDADLMDTREVSAAADLSVGEPLAKVPDREPYESIAIDAASGASDLVDRTALDVLSSETAPAPSALQAAAEATDGSDPKSWSRLLWLLIEAGDIAGAYWLTRSLQAQNKEVEIPPWLLRAVQCARWLTKANDAFADNLREALYEGEPVGAAQELLRLAAWLKLSILAPGSVPAHYLVAPAICPTLDSLIGGIQRFQNVGVFPNEELRGNASAERARQITSVCQQIRGFLADAPKMRFTYVPTNSLWTHLLSPQADLGRVLRLIANDRRDRLDDVQKVLLSLRDPAQISQHIVRFERTIKDRNARVGITRQQLIRRIETAVKIAEPWYQLVGRERELARIGGHVHEYIAALRETFRQTYTPGLQALDTLRNESDDLAIRTAAGCLIQTLAEVQQLLGLEEEVDLSADNVWEWLVRHVSQPEEALHRRLLWLPEVATGTDGRPINDDLPRIASALVTSLVEGRDLEATFTIWLERENYAVANLLLTQASDELRHELQGKLRTRLRGTQNHLRDEIVRLTEEVEQAFADEYISSERRAAYTAILATVSRSVEKNIPTAQGLLQQNVREELDHARTRHLGTLRIRWYALRNRMESQSVPLDAQTRVIDAIESAFVQSEVRLTETYLNHLDTMLSLDGTPDLDWLEAPRRRDYLVEFLTLLGRVSLSDASEQFHHADAQMLIRETTSVSGSQWRATLRKRWEQIGELAGGGQQLSKAIEMFLTALGFRATVKGQAVELLAIQVNRPPRRAHAQARMSLGDLARPLAQFGSSVHSDKGPLYDIFCVWDKIAVRDFADELTTLPLRNRSAIICYFGVLPIRTRRELRRLGQQANLSLLVIDDTLIAFLSQCGADPVFPALLYSAAPFSTIMPYYPFSAGGVPREVFFGREELRNSILDAHGTCIIYGGRQMGKSALLVNARDHFHSPGRGHYAWVMDIKLIGDLHSGSPPAQLWRYIFDTLKNERLVDVGAKYRSPEDVQQRIRELIQQKGRRIIMMFDEADNFLIADAVRNFQVVESLRMLMFDTHRRFKVIFAGLHNVQRFTNIPNQPFAHFGTPRSVGSLEPVIARELVREPLEAIGYRFANDTDILRILSYTNYHPGLIQLFCAELVRQLQLGQGASGDPPHVIGRGVVESVYRQSQVINAIRARFDWTLALDPAYQAIVWCIVEAEQQENRDMRGDEEADEARVTNSDSFEQGSYDTPTLLRLVRQRLPKGFADVDLDQLRSLLDELKGLGILLQTNDGRFRLSTPNIANLFADDVEQRLLSLAERDRLLQGPDFDRYHRPITPDALAYSPLTYIQERLMYWQESGVSLVLGSNALGLEALRTSAEQLTVNTEYYQVDHFQPIPQELVRKGDLLRAWLGRLEDIMQRHHHIVFFAELGADIEQIEVIVDSAVAYCGQIQNQGQQRIHIVFAILPEVAWAVLCSQPDLINKWERSLNKVAWLQLWSNEALQSRFGRIGLAMAEKHKSAISAATGGWPFLLDELQRRWIQDKQLEHHLQSLTHELEMPESNLARHFRDALGILVSPAVSAVLRFIAREGANGAIDRDLVTVDFIGDVVVASEEECQAALEYLAHLNCLWDQDGILVIDPLVRMVL